MVLMLAASQAVLESLVVGSPGGGDVNVKIVLYRIRSSSLELNIDGRYLYAFHNIRSRRTRTLCRMIYTQTNIAYPSLCNHGSCLWTTGKYDWRY
jgi:hypothetical protein